MAEGKACMQGGLCSEGGVHRESSNHGSRMESASTAGAAGHPAVTTGLASYLDAWSHGEG
jgi:hypothetical protein